MRHPRPFVRGLAVLGSVLACLAALGGLPGTALGDEGGQKQPAKAPPPAPEAKAAPEPAPAPEECAGPALQFPNDRIIQRADGKILYFLRTDFVAPGDLKKSLETLLSPDGLDGVTFREFGAQNVLLIEGEPEDVELAVEAASYFDVATPQVWIQATVVEITYDSNFEFGLDYLWDRGETGPPTLFQGAEAILNPTSFIGSTQPGGLPFQGTSVLFGFVGKKAEQYGLLDVTLQALQNDGKAEVLSKPQIICTQGTEATVRTTEDRQIAQFTRADLNNVTYQSSTLTTGVTLKVKPIHIGDNFVTLMIDPEVKGIQGVSALGTATLRPILTTRAASTTVTMRDGETLVIGGLYTKSSITSKAKTPLISDIPILGELFTRTQETKSKSELIFMLRPQIVRQISDFAPPPREVERLEEDLDCWRPAGPHLRCADEECDKEAPPHHTCVPRCRAPCVPSTRRYVAPARTVRTQPCTQPRTYPTGTTRVPGRAHVPSGTYTPSGTCPPGPPCPPAPPASAMPPASGTTARTVPLPPPPPQPLPPPTQR